MDVALALSIAECLPNPPSQVAPSTNALLSASYWTSVTNDLVTINACLSGLEEHDAVIKCRKLANEMVHAQREVIMSKMKKVVASRSSWMEYLDLEREKFFEAAKDEYHNQRRQQRAGVTESLEPEASTLFPDATPSSASSAVTHAPAQGAIRSAKYFCDKSLERLATDSESCMWESETIVLDSNANLILQLKLTPSIADFLELPDTYELPSTIVSSSSSSAHHQPCVGILYRNSNDRSAESSHTKNTAQKGREKEKAPRKTIIFRAPPLKRSGVWTHPNPPINLGNAEKEKETYSSSGTPDEDQMLYYLRLYLALGGERGNGQFLSHALIKEAAALLATQIALFELTQTPEAKFDLVENLTPPLRSLAPESSDSSSTSNVAFVTLYSRHTTAMAPRVSNSDNRYRDHRDEASSSSILKYFLPCNAIMPIEAIYGRTPPGSSRRAESKRNEVFTDPSCGLPFYDAAALQLHDARSFSWALKYCYGEILKGVLPPHVLRAPSAATGQGEECFCCVSVDTNNTTLFVPPSVRKYMIEYIK